MYKIVTTPDPILSQVAKPVTTFDKKLGNIIREMTETLLATEDPIGVGLAAPQVGLSIRMFLARPTETSPVTEFINPKILSTEKPTSKTSPAKKKLLEGCLSMPAIWGHVTRERALTLTWQDKTGHNHKKRFTGFLATIIQHETDHLNGILFTKHVLEQNNKLYKSYKNEENEDEFEEIKI